MTFHNSFKHTRRGWWFSNTRQYDSAGIAKAFPPSSDSLTRDLPELQTSHGKGTAYEGLFQSHRATWDLQADVPGPKKKTDAERLWLWNSKSGECKESRAFGDNFQTCLFGYSESGVVQGKHGLQVKEAGVKAGVFLYCHPSHYNPTCKMYFRREMPTGKTDVRCLHLFQRGSSFPAWADLPAAFSQERSWWHFIY